MPNAAQLLSRLSTRGWVVAGAVTVVSVVVLYMLLQALSAPSYTTLLTGLEPAQTGKMTAAPDQKGSEQKGTEQPEGPQLVVQQRFVKLGPTRGDQVAVESGLVAGDTVVTAGQMKLHNGSSVIVNNSVQPTDNPAPTPPNQ